VPVGRIHPSGRGFLGKEEPEKLEEEEQITGHDGWSALFRKNDAFKAKESGIGGKESLFWSKEEKKVPKTCLEQVQHLLPREGRESIKRP